MQRLHPRDRPRHVVELRRLPRLAGVGIGLGITGQRRTPARDLVHADVVGVRVEVLLVAVGDDHLRPLGADDAHEPLDGFVERRVGEVVGAGVRLGVGHPAVVVAEHVQRRRSRARRRCRGARPCARRSRLARISGVSTAGFRMSPASPPVQHTSTLCTPSAAYFGGRARALRRFVVGVRVHLEQAETIGVGHGRKATRDRRLPVQCRSAELFSANTSTGPMLRRSSEPTADQVNDGSPASWSRSACDA